MYKNAILRYAPEYWNGSDDEQTELLTFSDEFKQIAYEARQALQNTTKGISRIVRVQNVHDLGQLLIREQLLLVTNKTTTYYRVRRFIKLNKLYYAKALKYNLDHRRCGLSDLQFHTHVNQIGHNEILIAVQVVTSKPLATTIVPDNNLEYFMDYAIFFD